MPVVADKSTLQFSSSSAAAYNTFGVVESISSPEIESPMIESTPLNASFGTVVPGTPKWGSPLKVTLQFGAGFCTTLDAAIKNGTLMWFKETVADTSTEVFSGYVTKYNKLGTLENGKVVKSEVEIMPSAANVFTAGTS